MLAVKQQSFTKLLQVANTNKMIIIFILAILCIAAFYAGYKYGDKLVHNITDEVKAEAEKVEKDIKSNKS